MNKENKPFLCRDAEQVLSAHDVLGFIAENPELFRSKIHPETLTKIESALEVLCWMLGHNDYFCDAMDALIVITDQVMAKRTKATQ